MVVVIVAVEVPLNPQKLKIDGVPDSFEFRKKK